MDMTKTEFQGCMTLLRLCYPGMAKMDPEFWAACVDEYYRRVTPKWTTEAIRRAFDKAPHDYAQWFPSLGQFHELCAYHEKNLAHHAPPERQITDGQAPEPWLGDGAAKCREIVNSLSTAKAMGDE